MDIYIFSYGSLRNSQSRALTLPGERLTQETFLRGYARKFNAPVNGYLYLNVVRKGGNSVPGTLIRVTSEELERVKLREPGYECVEIGMSLEACPTGKAFAFIAPDNAYPELSIPKSYIETCLANVPLSERDSWLSDSIIENPIEDDSAEPVYANAV